MPEITAYPPGVPNWIDLATDDMDATIAFYSALFGWTCERGGDDVGGYSTFLKDGKMVAGVAPRMQPAQPLAWTSYLCTDDADKTTELVESHGGTVLLAPMDVMDIGRMAVFMDPTGAAFATWQPKSHKGFELSHVEGTYNWTELATRDRAAAIAFYTGVFGLTATKAADYTEFELNGHPVAGCLDMPAMVPAEIPPYWMPYFQAEQPGAKAAQAVSLGATLLVPETAMEQVVFSIVQDPQGSTFGLLKLNPRTS